jgi:hypothetical protein
MLTDEEIENIAQAHLRDTYPRNWKIVHREKCSDPDGIYFRARDRRTGQGYEGDGGYFVVRQSGAIWKLDSAEVVSGGLGYWLKFYAEGWHKGPYRLTIHHVSDPVRFAELCASSVSDIRVRSDEDGVKVVKCSKQVVLQLLQKLPCSFDLFVIQLRKLIPELEAEALALFEYAYCGDETQNDPDSGDMSLRLEREKATALSNAEVNRRFEEARTLGVWFREVYCATNSDQTSLRGGGAEQNEFLLPLAIKTYATEAGFRKLWDAVHGRAPDISHISWLALWKKM